MLDSLLAPQPGGEERSEGSSSLWLHIIGLCVPLTAVSSAVQCSEEIARLPASYLTEYIVPGASLTEYRVQSSKYRV